MGREEAEALQVCLPEATFHFLAAQHRQSSEEKEEDLEGLEVEDLETL